MKKILLLIAAFIIFFSKFVNAQDNYKVSDFQNDTLTNFYLKIIYLEVFERSVAHLKYPQLYVIKYIDTISGDTLFYNIYLDDAIKYFEQKTKIPAPKAKYGGIILTPDIYQAWKQKVLE